MKARLIIIAVLALAVGFVLGRVTLPEPAPPAWIAPSLADLERQALEATCKAQRAQDVIDERVRLTGKVNP